MQVFIADSETTGLVAPQACEIGWLHVQDLLTDFKNTKIDSPLAVLTDDSYFVGTYEERFRPTKPIELQASKITGIYMKDVLRCPSITTFEYPKSVKYMIGHNIAYDWRVFGQPEVKLICTKELAQLVFPKADGLKNHKLTTIIEWLYPEEGATLVANAHGALLDCKLVYLVLLKILEKLPQVETWEQLASLCSQGKKSYEELNKPLAEMKVIPIGKYKGSKFSEIPTDYLKWLGKQKDLSPTLERAIKIELTIR
jgi:exodeoxyribonuclease X